MRVAVGYSYCYSRVWSAISQRRCLEICFGDLGNKGCEGNHISRVCRSPWMRWPARGRNRMNEDLQRSLRRTKRGMHRKDMKENGCLTHENHQTQRMNPVQDDPNAADMFVRSQICHIPGTAGGHGWRHLHNRVCAGVEQTRLKTHARSPVQILVAWATGGQKLKRTSVHQDRPRFENKI